MVPRKILTVTPIVASPTPSSLVTDRSTVVRPFLPARRQYFREKIHCFFPDSRVPGSLSSQRRPTSLPPGALRRTSDRRSDSVPPVLPMSPRASSPTSGARASASFPLTLGTRGGEINAPPPKDAPRYTTRVAPSRRSFQRRCPPLSPPGHEVAVGLRCGKANTETLNISEARLGVSPQYQWPLHPFSYQGRVDNLVPLPHHVYRTEALSGGPFVARHQSTVFEVVYRVCRPSFVFAHATPPAPRSFGYCPSNQW